MTLHPQGKKGVNIDLKKYNTVKKFIIDKVKSSRDISYQCLSDLAVNEL